METVAPPNATSTRKRYRKMNDANFDHISPTKKQQSKPELATFGIYLQ